MKLKSFSLKVALTVALLTSCSHSVFAQTREQRREAVRLNNQALQLGKEGRLEEALAMLNQSVALEEDQMVLYNRSFAFYRLKRYDEALKDINKVLLRGEANIKGLSQRARIYSAQGNDVAAFKDLTQMLSLEPDNIEFAMRRGETAVDARHYVPALDSFYYAETLAQKQPNKAPEIAEMHQSIPNQIGIVYALLGLPDSSFTNKSTVFAHPFVEIFKPKANELRFDGICSSVNTKTGVFSFDTLSVSFPNGKTKVLPEPKRKVARLSGIKIQNAHNMKLSSPLKVGDFVVVTGVDNGKSIVTRALAQGMLHEHGNTEDESSE